MARSRRDGATIKRERIELMMKMLDDGFKTGNPNDGIPLKWFIATCEIRFGLSKGKIREYLGTLELLGRIKLEDGTADVILKGGLPG